MWRDRKHGDVNYYIKQVMTAPGRKSQGTGTSDWRRFAWDNIREDAGRLEHLGGGDEIHRTSTALKEDGPGCSGVEEEEDMDNRQIWGSPRSNGKAVLKWNFHRSTQRRILTTNGELVNEHRDPEQPEAVNEYQRLHSPIDYVQMAPRNDEHQHPTGATIYTYATNENGQHIICASGSPTGTIKLETIDKDQVAGEAAQQQQHLQHHQQCPTPNSSYTEPLVVSTSALHHQNPHNLSSSATHTLPHPAHIGSSLRFEDDPRYSSNALSDNGNGPPPLYYDPTVGGDPAATHGNESKTFTDLGNAHYLNFSSSSSYQLTQNNTVYSVTTAPNQLISNKDPNFSLIRQPVQYQSMGLYDTVNTSVPEQTLWSHCRPYYSGSIAPKF
uniref:Uncharacterized protein n=1 Tax=Stomoxys calcitrans TaxID=35570 RepID=A0A1I8P5I4_STOCA